MHLLSPFSLNLPFYEHKKRPSYKELWPLFSPKLYVLEQMNDLNYNMDYWDWILDLTEGNMALTEGN